MKEMTKFSAIDFDMYNGVKSEDPEIAEELEGTFNGQLHGAVVIRDAEVVTVIIYSDDDYSNYHDWQREFGSVESAKACCNYLLSFEETGIVFDRIFDMFYFRPVAQI
jgi:predicted choloylglycine hydrolase